MSEDGHHTNYVKIWAILMVLLFVSIIGPEFGIRWLTLFTAFGIACIKAYMVATKFMHIDKMPSFVSYIVVTCLFQGYEWVQLINEGLTLSSSALGSFFYLMVGMHALHAVGALGLLGYATLRLRGGWLTPSLFGAAEVFWFFVVGVWPVLYLVVYLR